MELQGRNVDEWGNVILSADGLIDHLMRGHDLSSHLMALENRSLKIFNDHCKEFDHPQDQVSAYQQPEISIEEWDKAHQSKWFTPEPFASMDVKEWLFEKCSTEEQVLRVLDEWTLYEERGMEPVLRFLIYAIDNFRKRKVVWGVGRGSSVASYILYLIGVHKVDSMTYNLDVREFLK